MKRLLLLTVMCVLGLFGTLKAQQDSFLYDFENGTMDGLVLFQGDFAGYYGNAATPEQNWKIADKNTLIGDGEYAIYSSSWDVTPIKCSNYIVTENAYQITETSTLTWFVNHSSPTANYCALDTYHVVVSETGGSDYTLYDTIYSATFEGENIGTCDFPAEYVGKALYIGFFHNGYNGESLILDNLRLDPAAVDIEDPDVIKHPDTPQNFAVSVEGKTIVLTWDAVENATYNVYQGPDPIVEGLTETTYTTGELDYGHHCYYVRAFRDNLLSDKTEDLCAEIATPVPQNVFAEAGETTITLTWDAVEGAAYYNVYQGTEKVASELTELTYTTAELEPGDYCFTVTSFKDDEESDPSEEACATVKAPVVDEPGKITIGYDSEETVENLPTNMYYGNTLSQQIYTAEELGGKNGNITKIAFLQKTTAERTRKLAVYMVNTDKKYFEKEQTDYVEVSAADMVFDGKVTTTAENEWLEIELQNQFYYEGKNIVLCVNDYTNEYGNRFNFQAYATDTLNRAIVNNRDDVVYDVNNVADMTDLSRQTYVNTIQFSIEIQENKLEVYPQEVALGDIMIGDYWTDKEEASAKVTVYATDVTVTEVTCDNAFFTLPESIDFTVSPIEFEVGYDKTAQAGEYTGTITIKTAEGDEAQVPVTATAYTPVEPDLFELAKEITFTENAFTDTPDFATLHDNYLLPNENKDNVAPDAVYSFTLEGDNLIDVNVEGAGGLYAIYKADSFAEGNGPQADNNYVSTDEKITDTAFIYNFNDESLADFTIIDNDEFKDHTWKIESGALISYSYEYWWNENNEGQSINRADERIVTNDAYTVTANSVLSFQATKGVDESQTHYGEAVIVEVTKDGETFTEVYSAVFDDHSIDWRTVRVDLGAIFVNKGIEFGDYRISIRHNKQGVGFVRVDYLALTERTIVYPAGEYYLVAAAKEAFTVNVQLTALGGDNTDNIEELTSSFSVYPNPVENMLFIEADTNVEEVSVYNVNGQQTIAISQQLSANSCTIDVENLTSGVYFIKVRTENGESVQRFIKK